jgi:hypothetical protein
MFASIKTIRIFVRQSKTKNMKIETEIKLMTERLAKRVNQWTNEGQELVDRFNDVLNIELSYISFENNKVKSYYRAAVLITMSINHRTHYEIVFPKIKY